MIETNKAPYYAGLVVLSVACLTQEPEDRVRYLSGGILSFLLPLNQEGQLSVTGESMCTKYLGRLSLPRKSVVRLHFVMLG